MIIFQFHYDETGGEKEAKALMQHIADKFPQITSLMYLDNQKCNDTIGDQEILTFKGTDHIFELMEVQGGSEVVLSDEYRAGLPSV